jgi:hypothetical protein
MHKSRPECEGTRSIVANRPRHIDARVLQRGSRRFVREKVHSIHAFLSSSPALRFSLLL